MTSIAYFLGAIFAGSAPTKAAPATPVVAVFTIQDTRSEGGLSEQALSELTDYLSVRLAEGGLYRLTPSAQVRQVLNEKKAETFKACFDESCQIELGKAVAAEKSLGTKILQVSSQTCVVTSTLFDLKTELTERAASAEGRCDRDAVAGSLKSAVSKLRGETKAPPAAVAAAPVAGSPAPPVSSPPPPPRAKRRTCRDGQIRHPREAGAELRRRPNERRPNVITVLKNGTRITAIRKRGFWVKVKVNNTRQQGWVLVSHVRRDC